MDKSFNIRLSKLSDSAIGAVIDTPSLNATEKTYDEIASTSIIHLGNFGFSNDIQLEIRLLRVSTYHNQLKNIRLNRLNNNKIGVYVDLYSYTSQSLSNVDLIPSGDFFEIASAGYSLDSIGLSGLLLDARVWIPTTSFLKELTIAKNIEKANELRERSKLLRHITGDMTETIQEKNRRLKKEAIESGTYSLKYKQTNEPTRFFGENSPEKLEVLCPKCKRKHISTSSKGFSIKKAGLGALLLGHIGVVAGFIGSNKPVSVCINCGHRW